MIEAQEQINKLLQTDESKVGSLSDGYHTFHDLYHHRCLLFIALMKSNKTRSWRSKRHNDGEVWPSWFVAGMDLPSGPITYHLPLWMWGLLDASNIRTLALAPPWDGHTSEDVAARLCSWITGVTK